MSILYSKGKQKFNYPYPHDPDEEKIYVFAYRPQVWKPGIEIVKNEDVVIPTVHTGFMYECTSSGITGLVEPTWETVEKLITEDNTVRYEGVPSVCMLKQGDEITESNWFLSDAKTWTPDTVVKVDESVKASSVDGFEYVCTAAGTTDVATEPAWVAEEGEETTSGDCVFIAKTVGQVADSHILELNSTSVKVIKSARSGVLNLRNEITVTRLSGNTEKFNRTLLVEIKEL